MLQCHVSPHILSNVNDKYSPRTLGWWVDERRGELGLTWDQFAEIAGVSAETLRRTAATNGAAMRTTTKKGIERALRWAPDYPERISRGTEPVKLAEAPEPEPVAEPQRDKYAEMDETLAELITRLQDMQRQVDGLRDDKSKGA